jgi:hypothetical protein
VKGDREPPVVVLVGEDTDLDPAGCAVALQGWDVQALDTTPTRPGVVYCGAVRTTRDAARAVLAVVHGAGLVIGLPEAGELVELVVGDLRTMGPVVVWTELPSADPVDEEQRRLLQLLGAGRTVAAAARECHLSLRTAHRRLAAAREVLEVSTTAEAILAVAHTDTGRPT